MAGASSQFRRATQWVRRALSTEPLEHVSRLQRLVFHNLRVAYLVSRSDVYDRVRLHAQALALKTLLAVVPLLAVVFAIFNGFGGLSSVRERLEAIVVENLAGSPEVQVIVHEYLTKFVSNVEGGALGPVSVVLLVYSVLSLLSHIEDSINTLFGVRAKRPIVLRFTTYWAVLTLGPLILGASLTLSGVLQIDAVRQTLESLPGASQMLIAVTPLLISWLGFTALYVVVPNTKVSLRSAFYAALVAGTAWNLLKYLYTYYASHAVTMQNIYGSLAAIPLFMLWIWWSWLLVLYGAQLAYAYDNVTSFWRERSAVNLSPRARETASTRIMLDIARNFTFGHDAADAHALVSRLALPRSLVDDLLEELRRADLVIEVESGGWLPARDVASISLEDVVSALRDGVGQAPGARVLTVDAPTTHLTELWEQERGLARELLQTSFAELARKFPPSGSEAPGTSVPLTATEVERGDVH